LEKKRTIRAYKDGDEGEILRLLRAVYPDASEDAIETLLRRRQWASENPAGRVDSWVTEEDGRILGQYRLLWMDLKLKNHVLKAAQGMDEMTHPDYRRQGINYGLARHAVAEAGRNGVQIVFGFVEHASPAYYANLKNGWFFVGTMRQLFKPINWKNLFRSKVNNPRVATILAVVATWLSDGMVFKTRNPSVQQGLFIEQIKSFDERISSLWARVADRYPIMVARSQRYLNWRYASSGQNYRIFIARRSDEILGYLILRHQTTHGIVVTYIFDILAESDEVMHSLVSRAAEDSRSVNAGMILYPLIAHKSHCEILKRNGFLSLPFAKGRDFLIYCDPSLMSRSFAKGPQNWLIQAGDSDKY